ncbi:MAG: type IV pilus modification PilV family protein [Candidatus Syntrophosphaera sp.]
MKKSILGKQRGVSLVEVISVMLISTMLIVIAGLGIGAFFKKYKELNAWAELQKDALECLDMIKNGVAVGSGNNIEYYGVTNAMQLRLTNTTTNTSSSIRITPPSPQGLETTDYAHFYLYDGVVRCTYVHHGIQAASPLYVFPKRENTERMTVEKFEITKINEENDLLAIRVELFAKVETGTDQYRSVRFRTKMVKK